ncbi:MAG: hypothetical protein MPK31_05805 [Gammaproteobacteria bacterium]|nr:hypothetical protein [Gammaproteobacteria bacterium]
MDPLKLLLGVVSTVFLIVGIISFIIGGWEDLAFIVYVMFSIVALVGWAMVLFRVVLSSHPFLAGVALVFGGIGLFCAFFTLIFVAGQLFVGNLYINTIIV